MHADATIYVGGLDDKVTETILWELFLQAGPVGECILARELAVFACTQSTYT